MATNDMATHLQELLGQVPEDVAEVLKFYRELERLHEQTLQALGISKTLHHVRLVDSREICLSPDQIKVCASK